MTGEFRPLDGRARWATAGIAAVLAVDVVRIWSDWLEVKLVDKLLANELDLTLLDDLDANDDRQLAIAIVRVVVYLASAVLFIRWFHAAYSNITSVGVAAHRFGRGWAIGAWFVPILNLWRPKQIANDIWRAGALDLPTANVNSLAAQPVAALVTVWWAVWIVSGVLENVVGSAAFDEDTIETRSMSQFDMFSAGVEIVACVLAIAVIRRTTTRLNARREHVATRAAAHATIAPT